MDKKVLAGVIAFLETILFCSVQRSKTAFPFLPHNLNTLPREDVTQLLWLKQMLDDYKLQSNPLVIFHDNKCGIQITRNLVQHSRTKHIEIHYHFPRDLVDRKVVQLEYISTKNQLSDIFTKPLDYERFLNLRKSLCRCSL